MAPFLAHGAGAKVTVEAQEVDTMLAAGWVAEYWQCGHDGAILFCKLVEDEDEPEHDDY